MKIKYFLMTAVVALMIACGTGIYKVHGISKEVCRCKEYGYGSACRAQSCQCCGDLLAQ